MTSKELKRYLFDNPTFIVSILEELECHQIKITQGKRITCALPDGDNPTSVQIVLVDDDLGTIVHTRKEYKGGDIFNFVEFIKDCPFKNAMMFMCRVVGVEYSVDYKQPTDNKTYDFLRKFSKGFSRKDEEEVENVPISELALNDYIKTPHQMFIDDFISAKTQVKFGILYDIHEQRILIPIRDTLGNLISIKGRIATDVFDKLKVMRYIAYFDYYARYILFGYYENYWNILFQREVILVESEKGVMQADSYGVGNVLALSKKKISDEQLFMIISLNADVVLALDKDVTIEEIEKMAQEFKGLCKVYALFDTQGLLEGKESPTDKGKEVFEELYKTKIRIL